TPIPLQIGIKHPPRISARCLPITRRCTRGSSVTPLANEVCCGHVCGYDPGCAAAQHGSAVDNGGARPYSCIPGPLAPFAVGAVVARPAWEGWGGWVAAALSGPDGSQTRVSPSSSAGVSRGCVLPRCA